MSPSAKGYVSLKILLIISSPSSVSLRLPLSFIVSVSSWCLNSCCLYLCYFVISAIALGGLGETVRRDLHREKCSLGEVGQTERRVLLAEGREHNEIFYLLFSANILCLPVNICNNSAFRYFNSKQ